MIGAVPTKQPGLPALLAGALLLAACDDGGPAPSETPTAPPPAPAGPPPGQPAIPPPAPPPDANDTFGVDAGYGRVVLPAAEVTLRATVSAGPAASIIWSQRGGPAAEFRSAGAAETTVTVPADLERTAVLLFEVTAESASGEAATDTVWIEAYVPDQDPADLTALADFSARPGWACDQDPIERPVVLMQELGANIEFHSNGIPRHATGTYPNRGNPNTIGVHGDIRRVPRNPVKTDTASEMAEFGITLDGIKLDRDTAESYRNERRWNYEALTPGMARRLSGDARFEWLGSDCNNAHVQPTGDYHYHGPPRALLRELTGGTAIEDIVLGGYAADGFPFYLLYGYEDPMDPASGLVAVEASWGLRAGERPTAPGGAHDGTFREDWQYVEGSGDLDECGGRFGVTPEFPEGTYHYYLTNDYPYVPRCVFGTPDPSFRSRRAPPPGG